MSSLFELDIQNCKGVGPQRAKLFRKLGVPTVGDLLRLYPRAYEDWSQHCLIRDTTLNEVAVVKATVLRRPTEHRVKGGKLLYKTTVTDGDSDMALTFFNNKYIPCLLYTSESCYAIQAGREIRVMVKPEKVSDEQMTLLARDICKKIEADLDYPGTIKVNMIRESRTVDYAK